MAILNNALNLSINTYHLQIETVGNNIKLGLHDRPPFTAVYPQIFNLFNLDVQLHNEKIIQLD